VDQAPPAGVSSLAEVHSDLGAVLRDAGYGEPGLRRVLGAAPERAVDPEVRPLAVRRAEEAADDALASLARLLVLGSEVDGEEAEGALAPLALDALAEAGVLERRDAAVRALVRILPYEGLLLAHDPPAERGGFEEVTAPGPSARTLASLTVRRRVHAALDLGSGGGVQGLLLARHADRVVMTDVSERARAVAGLNARLNAIDNVELRTGDWFEPVAGERFDLIAANLPYVVSPDVDYVHRDNPSERDELSRSVVGRIGEHLVEGGIAHVLCNWVHGESEPWADAPLAWVADTGCDALVLHYGSHEPLEYAASWNRPLRERDPNAYEATIDRWLDYYRGARVERIASGAVVLRRRGAGAAERSWARPIEVPDAPTGKAGDHVERLLRAQDELARLSGPEALLAERFEAAPGQRLDQTMAYGEGGYAADAAYMRCMPGVGVTARVDPRVMPVVVGCDGKRPLGELIARATESLGRDRVEVATLCFATVRTAYELGLIRRVGGGDAPAAPAPRSAGKR
jgi:methylase of polypeptide subunit release factors